MILRRPFAQISSEWRGRKAGIYSSNTYKFKTFQKVANNRVIQEGLK